MIGLQIGWETATADMPLDEMIISDTRTHSSRIGCCLKRCWASGTGGGGLECNLGDDLPRLGVLGLLAGGRCCSWKSLTVTGDRGPSCVPLRCR